jgi:hypothetical protein
VPKQITIRLVDRERAEVATPRVDVEAIAGASIIKYDGRWFAFAGFGGTYYQNATFAECSPPLELPK